MNLLKCIENQQALSKYLENNDPGGNILNDEDQSAPVNAMDELNEKNEADEKIQAFEEGIRNDTINTEEDINKAED